MDRRFVLASLLGVALDGFRSSHALEPTPTGYDFSNVRDEAVSAVAAGKATGLAVAALHRGRTVWAEGFGWANREAGLKATPHTPFSLASMSKPFTATALTMLAADGKLSLDEPANKYLAQNRLRGIESNAATVRQLGAHASGLPSLFEMYPASGGAQPENLDALLLSYGKLAFPPGRVYEYSNIGYAALAAIALRLTGQTIGENITRRVLRPLGMRDSFFVTDRSDLARASARYDEMNKPIPFYTTATPSSGGVYASAHDLARFANFTMNGSTEGGQLILSQRWIDELHKPVLHGAADGATTFGWFSGRSHSGRAVLMKDGTQPGVCTIMYIVPSEDLACVVLSNRTDNGQLVFDLVDKMIAAVLPGWRTPDIQMNAPRLPFSGGSPYIGQWSGRLSGDGIDVALDLNVSARTTATLAVAGRPAERISNLQRSDTLLTAMMSGMIASPDVERNNATDLNLKLLPFEGGLVGRILATASRPGWLAVIPFTVSLDRLNT